MNYKILLTLALSFQINGVELPAYEARYSYESDEINIEGIRKFSKDPNSFNLSFKAKNLLASMSFESIFLIAATLYFAAALPELAPHAKFQIFSVTFVGLVTFSWILIHFYRISYNFMGLATFL